MIVLLRRASKGFEILKRGRSICNQTEFCFSNRWYNSDSAATYGNDAKILDSSEFQRWHNGGGIFHRSASIDPTVCIEIGAVVHPNSVLGEDVHVGSGTIVGPSVSIRESTKLGYNVVLSNCSIGQFCIIHNGVCIGQDGFGFFVDEEGHVCKKPQILHARIGDHVEIGANTCIDRGSWRDTVVGDYTKIDNLVQIGHNALIGKCCILCGQVGIAGSVTLGDYVTLGGRVAVRDHVSIASKVRLAANSSVTKDIAVPGDYAGFPAVPINEWRRQSVNLRLLSKSLSKR
ncbi:probable UDP-3-O-acylglucosamine N-acyltransferase 2, mitochondrial [Typha latifolia]|uniref:probable UDP-3-O-acylglucosamine N-acyltransferase 2, mitochondrial n=1 Tax=Typha latifolia TaxID=4733 RepID=UPI003C301AB5